MPGYDTAQTLKDHDDLGRWRFAAEIAEIIRSTPADSRSGIARPPFSCNPVIGSVLSGRRTAIFMRARHTLAERYHESSGAPMHLAVAEPDPPNPEKYQ